MNRTLGENSSGIQNTFTKRWSLLLAIPVAIYLLYSICVFLFLSTSIFPKVVDFGPKNGKLLIKKGWSFWPSTIELRGVELEIEDSKMHLWVHLPEVQAHIHLFELFRKKIHIDSLVTPHELHTAITAEIQRRSEKEKSIYLEEKAALVEQSEKSRHSDKTSSKNSGPQNTEDNHWHLRFENIQLANLRQFRFDNWILTCDSSIEGNFSLTPGIRAQIWDAAWTIRSGDVPELMRSLHGSVKADFAPFSVKDVRGAEIFRFVSSEIELQSDLVENGGLDLKSRNPIELKNLNGKLQLVGKIRAGKVERGSRVALHVSNFSAQTRSYDIHGKGKFTLTAHEGSTAGLVLGAELENLSLQDLGKKGTKPFIQNWNGKLTATSPQEFDLSTQIFGLIGTTSIQLKNTDIPLEILHHENKISEIAMNLSRSDNVRVSATLRQNPEVFQISNIDLHAGTDISGEGDLLMIDSLWRGAVVLKKGIASVGVILKDSEMNLALLPGDHWLRQKLVELGLKTATPAEAHQQSGKVLRDHE